MKLKVLVDNNTYIDEYYLAEPAVGFYIEDAGKKILFDTGYSDVFLRNAEAMGIDIQDLDMVVLSHGHNDHTGGLSLLAEKLQKKLPLISCPDVLEEKRFGDLSISAKPEEALLEENFLIQTNVKPVKISENLIFLGEIERTTDFENKEPVGERYACGCWQPDFLADDSALVYNTPEGIYIITGCSHAGICNIIAYGKKVCNNNVVKGVIGGFHLMSYNEQAEKTIAYLVEHNIPHLYPCHCTSFQVKSKMNQQTPVQEVGVGLELEW